MDGEMQASGSPGKKQHVWIAALVVVLLVVIFGIWYVSRQTPQTPPDQDDAMDGEDSLGGSLFDEAENPGGDIPETNPFSGAETNPFSGYENPFDAE